MIIKKQKEVFSFNWNQFLVNSFFFPHRQWIYNSTYQHALILKFGEWPTPTTLFASLNVYSARIITHHIFRACTRRGRRSGAELRNPVFRSLWNSSTTGPQCKRQKAHFEWWTECALSSRTQQCELYLTSLSFPPSLSLSRGTQT